MALLLTFLLSLGMARRLTRPLQAMARAATHIAQGDLSARISHPTHDEVGLLVQAFNAMATQLETQLATLTQEREQLEAIFRAMTDGVLVTDKEGRILLVNTALRHMLSLHPPIEGRTILEVFRHVLLQQLIERVLKGEGAVTKEISLQPRQDRILEVHVVPLGKSPTIQGSVVVLHDITPLRQLEQVRRDFVTNASHEMRTPLTAIAGYAETLLDGALSEPEHAEKFVQIILKHAQRLNNLVEDMLQLSRIESQSFPFTPRFLSLEPLCQRIGRLLGSVAQQKQITLYFAFPPNLPPAFVDEEAMEQILINLLDNAIKYTPEGGIVTMRASVEGTMIHLEVADTGIGVPEKDLTRIFERFNRVDKGRSREMGGTGLGLSIVKHLVQMQEGRVWAESRLGVGSTFHILLPRLPATRS
jgi:two-component system phosphate regulon sensor histidine kinase PhoR